MAVQRKAAVEFARAFGRAWERWDRRAWLDLFTDDVAYVVHPSEETVVGRPALGPYFEKEAAEQGEVSVTIGNPVVDGERVAAEFWVTSKTGEATIAGCFIAVLAPDGRCRLFREYWFQLEQTIDAYDGWGS